MKFTKKIYKNIVFNILVDLIHYISFFLPWTLYNDNKMFVIYALCAKGDILTTVTTKCQTTDVHLDMNWAHEHCLFGSAK